MQDSHQEPETAFFRCRAVARFDVVIALMCVIDAEVDRRTAAQIKCVVAVDTEAVLGRSRQGIALEVDTRVLFEELVVLRVKIAVAGVEDPVVRQQRRQVEL